MAQETAGTIGIPVIKNEVLPALENYARRQERYERLKAAQEAKAAEAAAKKAAEDAKFVPKFESGKGGYFGHILESNQSKRINDALSIYKDPNTPTQTKMLVANEANRLNNEENVFSKDNDARLRQAAEDLSKNKFRLVGEGDIVNWSKKQSTFQTPEKFIADIKSDPNLIDFDAIGKTAKDYKASDYSYRDKNGVTKTIKMSPLFEYKFEKDPFVGTEVPKVVGVNGVEAQALIESNPDIKEAFDVWTKNRAKEYQGGKRTYIDPYTGSPTLMRPELTELAEDQAAKEFMEQTFGKYGTVKYGQQFSMPRKGGEGGSSKPPVEITTKAKKRSHSVPYSINGVNYAGVVDVGTKGDWQHTFDRDYNLPAGLKIRPIGDYEDIAEWEKKIIEKKPDGTFATRGRLKYDGATETKLHWTTQDVEIPDSRGNINVIKKGSEITPDNALYLERKAKKENKPAPVAYETGYEITGQMELYDPEEGVNKRQEVHFFVPKQYASGVQTHIEMQRAKYKSKPSVAEVEEEPWKF
jgi:hypothetical protein